MTGQQWPREHEERLRRALHNEADRVVPSADALAQIRRRTSRVPFWRNPAVIGVVAATAATAAVIAVAVTMLRPPANNLEVTSPGGSESAGEPTTEVSPSDASPSPSESVPSAEPVTVPVYYVAETPAGFRLAREFRTVPGDGGPLVAAVRTMLTLPANDPDYRSLWNEAAGVLGTAITDGVIEVDLADAPGELVTDDAELAVQQLVYTVTAAAAMAGLADGPLPVQILLDGEPATGRLDPVDVSVPIQRADPLEVRQRVQINDPAEGAVSGSPLVVTGEAAVFEANVPWQVLRDGDVVLEGYTTAEECCRFAPFSFEVELEPGDYLLVITEDDPSDGEGPGPMSDSRSFSIE